MYRSRINECESVLRWVNARLYPSIVITWVFGNVLRFHRPVITSKRIRIVRGQWDKSKNRNFSILIAEPWLLRLVMIPKAVLAHTAKWTKQVDWSCFL